MLNPVVKHCVTVRADRDKIFHRIKSVLSTDGSQWNDVVDVDKPISDTAVGISKIDLTNLARCTVVPESLITRAAIAFVFIDYN